LALHLQAIDLDAPGHGNVSYYLSGNVKMTLSEGLEHVKRSPFIVDRHTGGIILNFDPQRGMKGYFEFMVYLLKIFNRNYKMLIYLGCRK
jgi:hypothetical protein